MKTNGSFETHNINNISSRFVRPVNAKKNEAVQVKTQETLKDLTKKRNLINAVIVSQIAQNFIQNALIITTKLREIATEGIITGKLSGHELEDALAGMKNPLDYLNSENVKIMQSLENFMTTFRYAPADVRINEELKTLADIVNNPGPGKFSNLKSIDNIKDALLRKESAVNGFAAELTGDLPFNRESAGNTEFSQPVEVSDFINSFPDTALLSQGNIMRQSVSKLL